MRKEGSSDNFAHHWFTTGIVCFKTSTLQRWIVVSSIVIKAKEILRLVQNFETPTMECRHRHTTIKATVAFGSKF